jgi:Family of unknown function (DUF6328)
VARRPDETELERLDRNLGELLQELRVALPGVQVLFGFLLTVPFAQGFQKTTSFQRDVYFVTLMCAAASSALIIATTAYHRILFRRGQKEHLLFLANRLTIAGLGSLALAMTGTILLVTDYLFSAATTIVATVVVGTLFGGLWYVLPLLRRLGHPEEGDLD